MAQAMIQSDKEYKLSEVTSVLLNGQGCISFVITPKQDFLPKINIPFTKPNWYSLMLKAKPEIERGIEERMEMSIVYHNHTRVAQLIWRDDETFQVHLMVYTMKGSVKTDMCVFLTQWEYGKLAELSTQITKDLNKFSPQHEKKSIVMGYRCKVSSDNPEVSHLPLMGKLYLRYKDAAKQELIVRELFPTKVDKFEIQEEILATPDPGNFMRKVFLAMVFFTCRVAHDMAWCTGCAEDWPANDEGHLEEDDSCHDTSTPMDQVIVEEIKGALEKLSDKFVKDVFLTVWNAIEFQTVTDIALHMQNIHNHMDIKNTSKLVMYHLENFEKKLEEDPEYMVIGEMVENSIKQFLKDEKNGVDTPDTYIEHTPIKKRKIEE